MKKIILAIILCSFIFQNGKSQQEPQLKKYINSYKRAGEDTFIVELEILYDYDQFNNISFKEIKYYNSVGKLWIHKGISYEYYPNQLLKKENFRRYNSAVDLWITEDFIEYKYDLNNCLIEEHHIENVGGKYTRKIIYQQNENCKWDLKYEESPTAFDNSIFYTRARFERIYFPDETSYEERQFEYVGLTDSSYLFNFNFQIYDERNNLIEENYFELYPIYTNYVERKIVINYDEFDHKISKERFDKKSDTSELELINIISYDNEYDENNFLKKTREELLSYNSEPPSINPFFSFTTTYKNTCEGIIELIDVLNDIGNREREQFIYKGKNECIDLEKIYLNIHVSPNPSNGFFKIFSPIFQTGSTEILVFSTDGKVLLQKNEHSRATHSSVDLSILQNGFYILQLRNGNHFVKSKIVIAK
ncbi:MAG: T9SS type A sorting domain-containing protein [Saprospiraceae bacterium]